MSDRLPLLLRLKDAMAQLSCSRSHVYKLLATGELQFVKDGRFRRVTRSSLLNYIAKRTRQMGKQDSA